MSALPDTQRRAVAFGRANGAAIRSNVSTFRGLCTHLGWDWDHLTVIAQGAGPGFAERAEEQMAMALGSGVQPTDLTTLDAVRHIALPDECTVAAAVGSAAASGSTVFLKNSDKVGSQTLRGDGFYRFKEINVTVDVTTKNHVRILGVAAAGSTGLKMGVNSEGVIAASNIVRTSELRRRGVSLTDIRAFDRAQLLRLGLEHRSAEEAAKWAYGAVQERPMATPGNVQFASSKEMWILEASYEEAHLECVSDDVAVRANAFVWLSHLNDPNDVSSPTRRQRALDLLQPRRGRISPRDMVAVSCDHENGPGLNSICRHSSEPEDETSLSAMIVALTDGGEPSVGFALGKPCHAWRDESGFLTAAVQTESYTPAGFSNGQTWKEFYLETPRLEASPPQLRI